MQEKNVDEIDSSFPNKTMPYFTNKHNYSRSNAQILRYTVKPELTTTSDNDHLLTTTTLSISRPKNFNTESTSE